MAEAETLNLRRELGGGSKWRPRVYLAGLLLAALRLVYFRFARDFAPEKRIYAMVGFVVVVSIIVFFLQQARKKKERATSRLELSDAGLAILSDDSRVVFPWPAFSGLLESPNLFVLVDRPKKTMLVLPKRVFPDEGWQTWLRNVVANRADARGWPVVETPRVAGSGAADSVRIRFRLGFWNYVDRSIASWFTRGAIIFFAGIFVYATIQSAAHPPPQPVYSTTQVFFMAGLPFMLVMAVMVVAISSVYTWLDHRKTLIEQEVVLSREGIEFASADASGMLPWSASYRYYKETPWSFILWNPNRLWTMLPKRKFTSAADVNRCRELLASNLKKSQWFIW